MIWCVEDDASIRDIELYALTSTGFEARGFDDGASFWEALQTETPELVLLDVMLPGEDGVSLLKKMKAAPALRDIPVIMATAKGAEYDKIQSLDLGADDYLVKPFALEELSARLRVLTRSQFGAGDSRLVAGDLTLDTGTRRVKRGGAEIALSAREYALLEYLIRSKGVVLSRQQIEDNLWSLDYAGGTNVVDVYISYLRKKLELPGERKLLHTVRGMGWVLKEDA